MTFTGSRDSARGAAAVAAGFRWLPSHWRAGWHDLRDLIQPGRASPLLDTRKAEAILPRVRLVADLSAVLTLLLIVADLMIFPIETAAMLVLGRVVAGLLFLAVAIGSRRGRTLRAARLALASLILIATLFFLSAKYQLADVPDTDVARALASLYMLFPFVIAAGIAIFPLTVLEALVLLAPVLAAKIFVVVFRQQGVDWVGDAGQLWLMSLISAIAIAACANQLHFMRSLLKNTSRDALTGGFMRAVGEELLRMYFRQSRRTGSPLALILLDLDDFKQVNDRFGHDAGDAVLREYGVLLNATLRDSDLIVRWGGDELLLVLPNVTPESADHVVQRLWREGRVLRADGRAQTASIGIAERVADDAKHWRALVRRADERAYDAKRNGKDCFVCCAGNLHLHPHTDADAHTRPRAA